MTFSKLAFGQRTGDASSYAHAPLLQQQLAFKHSYVFSQRDMTRVITSPTHMRCFWVHSAASSDIAHVSLHLAKLTPHPWGWCDTTHSLSQPAIQPVKLHHTC